MRIEVNNGLFSKFFEDIDIIWVTFPNSIYFNNGSILVANKKIAVE